MSESISNLSAWDQFCLKIGSQNLVELLEEAEEHEDEPGDRQKFLAEKSGLPISEIPEGGLVYK